VNEVLWLIPGQPPARLEIIRMDDGVLKMEMPPLGVYGVLQLRYTS
jgi:hypothetical protein